MSIDFKEYTVQNEVRKKKWTPPTSESVMNERSNKLAMSTRAYPEYMLAAFAHLQEFRNCEAKSLSDLVYKIICEYINQNMDEIGTLPDAETALDFLLMKKWISPENAENLVPIGRIREKQSQLQVKVDSGEATLKEQYEYWKDRDPEKAEAIMEEMTQQLAEGLAKDEEPEPEVKDYSSDKSEQVVEDNQGAGIATPDHLDQVETAEGDEDE